MSNTEIQSRIIKTEVINWRDLQFIQQDEFKEWVLGGEQKLYESLLRYQFIDPFKVWEHEGVIYCLDGKHRFTDLKKIEEAGMQVPEMLPATFINCQDKKEAAELVLIYSSRYARITEKGFTDFISMYELNPDDFKMTIDLPDFDPLELESMFTQQDGSGEPGTGIVPQSLHDRFIIPPFSVFDTRQGYWQARKKHWNSVGFDSQESREDIELIAQSGQAPAVYELRNKMRDILKREPTWEEILVYAKEKGLHIYEGASIFDPVLCEIAYKWYCMPGGTVLDPFAGGSVRGIVASILNYRYHGIDLREQQVQANFRQADKVCNAECLPAWYIGDSNKVLDNINIDSDFVFSCPPYHDLEQYSDDPADLSNMDYSAFLTVYRSIISKAVARLKDNRFACFVVGDIRDKSGFYRNFVSDTISAFKDAGMMLYNEIILVNTVGSLAIRVGRQFAGYRKVGKMHQNVLVFYKGDPKKIPELYPEIEIDEQENTTELEESMQ
jgi:DNA modification methylase